jgi:hypothetical protein
VLNIKVTSNNLIYILVFFHIFWRLIIIFPDLISFLYYWKKIKQINLKSNYFPTGSDPLLTHLPDPTHGIPTRVSAARSLPLSPTHCRVGPVCLRPPSPMHLTLLCFAAQHTTGNNSQPHPNSALSTRLLALSRQPRVGPVCRYRHRHRCSWLATVTRILRPPAQTAASA